MACDMTFEEHREQIEMALHEGGVGGAFETAYKAQVEIAEVSRRLHGFTAHVPDDARVNRMVEKIRAFKAELEARRMSGERAH